ncbi:type II secretion system protein [Cellulomonas sp. APG4]|uniref:PilW family protein n=1 Tax=Cellulomonas sp. APG4 TaxID=1538656 RepID=UPI001ED92278|nr:type II secretion system protein [Cellulomonas sp. APG4]NCT90867.1 type II secretion system protein [Cellulomonas sp. APG4]
MTRIRSRLPRGEGGLTLPELLVTMTLTAIIGSLMVAFMSGYSRTLTRESARSDSTNVAAVGMNELTRVIRAGVRIENEHAAGGFDRIFRYAGRERLQLHAGVDSDATDVRPLLIDFSLDAGRVLTETRTTARAGGPGEAEWMFSGAGATITSRPIARTIVPATSPQTVLFRYFDSTGAEMVPSPGSSLPEADLDRITAVEIYLSVQADPTERAEPVTLTNRVGLLNAP